MHDTGVPAAGYCATSKKVQPTTLLTEGFFPTFLKLHPNVGACSSGEMLFRFMLLLLLLVLRYDFESLLKSDQCSYHPYTFRWMIRRNQDAADDDRIGIFGPPSEW